jgi:hypothetical protein
MAISCVMEYPEDYCHERFYGITQRKTIGFEGISRAKPLAYSSSGSEISRNDFHSSRRRAAVKISVEELRMKFSAGSLQWQPAGVPPLRVPLANTRCF